MRDWGSIIECADRTASMVGFQCEEHASTKLIRNKFETMVGEEVDKVAFDCIMSIDLVTDTLDVSGEKGIAG